MDVRSAIEGQTHRSPDSFALLSPGRKPIIYSRLLTHCYRVLADLNRAGISRGDRVAVVLPNGPEMAACFLAVAMGASCAPLNPLYRRSEFEFYISTLEPRALIVPDGADSPAIESARAHGIQVIRLRTASDDAAGIFGLDLEHAEPNVAPIFAQPGDEALVLFTSGTTSRPKMVPLTQANLAASIDNIIATLALTPRDRSLNVMPLFHVNGLIGVLLASLAAGASVVCTPGFYAPHFFEWCREFEPTWYSAVPTMHQSLLSRVHEHPELAENLTFRFIRSGAAPLSPRLMEEMERAFKVPVIEGYGLTETTQQVAVNPQPPAKRKPGSVGIPGHTAVGIMGEDGELKASGQTGEIVVRGPAVMAGYINNARANSETFTNGWFRTGDEGRLDADGYLYVTGRIKEIINRGGQKISPREIDELLASHPGVANGVAFPVPDFRLGEDVAAAVVLHAKDSVSEFELRSFLAEQVADYKVPRQIHFVDEIPTGPTGKLQRANLAAQLGLVGGDPTESLHRAPYVAPSSETQRALAEVWTSVLGVAHIGINDHFLALGGDSLLLAQLTLRMREAGWPSVSMLTFFERPTIAGLAALIDSEGKGTESAPDATPKILTVQPHGSRTPIFMIRGFTIFRDLSRRLGLDQPIYALLDPEIMNMKPPYDLVEIARLHVRTILNVRAHGPYAIGGFSAGGPLAYEVAQQLTAAGHQVPLLVLFDSSCPVQPQTSWLSRMIANVRIHTRELHSMGIAEYPAYLKPLLGRRVRAFKRHMQSGGRGVGSADLEPLPDDDPSTAFLFASRAYRPQPYCGRTVLFKRTRWLSNRFALPDCGWGAFIPDHLEVCEIAGDHFSMFVEPDVAIMADKLRPILAERWDEKRSSEHEAGANSAAAAD